MRFVFYPVPQKSDGCLITIWQNFLLRKSGVFDTPKHRSPGSSRKLPEGFPEDFPEGFFSKMWLFRQTSRKTSSSQKTSSSWLFLKLWLLAPGGLPGRFLLFPFLIFFGRGATLFYLILNKKVDPKKSDSKNPQSRKVPEGPGRFPGRLPGRVLITTRR